MGTLFVVATPLGNLGDLSSRASEVLRRVPVVAAEDTRVTRKLLSRLGASPRLVSYHEDSPASHLGAVLAALDTGDVALTTDAGTPGLSDPGASLVREAAARGHAVVPLPGPSAVTALLSISGLAASRFLFLGFLPRAGADRRRVLRDAAPETGPVVFFEAPHRLTDALEDVSAIFGDRRLVVGRELTKLHEEVFRGTAASAQAYFRAPRGEFVIAVEGAPERSEEIADAGIEAAIARLKASGLGGRALVDRAAAETGAPRSRVYRLFLGAVEN